MESQRENVPYLPGVELQPQVTATNDVQAATYGASVFVSALPSHAVRTVWQLMAPLLPEVAILVSATKGIEVGSLRTMSEVLLDTLPAEKSVDVAVLSGPSFAHEVSKRSPTAAVVAARDHRQPRWYKGCSARLCFGSTPVPTPSAWNSAAPSKTSWRWLPAVCDGLRLGANARAALITRSLAEMTQLGVAMGARPQTFAGLSGLGDLVLTCTGERSRNHYVGVQLGKGRKLTTILSGMRMVAEGVTTAECAAKLAARLGVEMPIAEKVNELLQGHISPSEAVMELMTRTLKHEEPTS